MIWSYRAAIFVCGSLLVATTSGQSYYTVQVEEGLLRGISQTTANGLPYVRFSGVPYAEPPVGELRFMAPVAKGAWNGTRDAIAEGSGCTQMCGNVPCGSEDCLYLNIYTPKIPVTGDEPKKVMVFIHGGAFFLGSGSKSFYGPDFILEGDVILVTCNYRLGPLGFLSLENEIIPGNMGLKDQNRALQWIKRNIAVFGGDPDDVTIWGQSAGSSSVQFQILSPLSNGLFTRAISHSGVAIHPWALTRSARQRAFALGSFLGLETQDDNELLQFLRGLDAEVLVQSMFAPLIPEGVVRILEYVFVPCVEPDLPGAFLTEDPSVLVAEGRYNQVPMIIGGTSGEANIAIAPGGILSTEETVSALDQNFVPVVSLDMRLPTLQEQEDAAAAVRNYYFADRPLTLNESLNLSSMLSDMYFGEGVDTMIRSAANNFNVSLHYYRFSYKGAINNYPDLPGVTHSDDLLYLFYANINQNLDPTSEEGLVRTRMVKMWTNFAKFGTPTPVQDSILPVSWTTFTTDNRNYLEIGANLSVEVGVNEENLNFWHNILGTNVLKKFGN